jgi:two-component system cell cycle response regulator
MHHSNIVDHITAFTSQRDTEMIEFSLLKSIKLMLSSNKSSIITMDKKGDITGEMVHEGEDYVVHDCRFMISDYLLKAYKLMKDSGLQDYTLKTESNIYLLMVIQNDHFVEKFLVIEQAIQISKAESYVLSGIISIYNNFIDLLKESQIDELTGLANRKTFDTSIKKIYNDLPLADSFENERRQGREASDSQLLPHWLAILDIDNFKSVNDNFGHLYGDEILIQLAQIIRTSFREEDLKFRFGGEEFIILFKAVGLENCKQALERFREEVASHNFPQVGQVTVSIGAVQFSRNQFHVTLIDYADQALYHSKKSGKNQVSFFEEMLAAGLTKVNEIESGDLDLF